MKFSVVVCTYNRAKYLLDTLESAVNQNYPKDDYEIIVVDNNSVDDTEKVCNEFLENHPESKFHYFLETRQGVSFSRNRGVEEAQGEFIVFLDDDETISSDYLNNLNNFFNEYKDASLCAGPVVPVFETIPPDWLSPFISRALTGFFDKGSKIKILTKDKDCPGTGHATFRRKLFTQIGGFNPELGRKGSSLLGAEDKDFFLRLRNKNIQCYYLPSAIIYHHIPAYKLSDEFFDKMTYSIGVSEKIRTLSISRFAYFCKLFLNEGMKWAASFLLFFYYLLIRCDYPKAKKIIRFRCNITKGLVFPDREFYNTPKNLDRKKENYICAK